MVNEAMSPIVEEDFKRWRAAHAEALRLAQRVRTVSPVFRRYAGELKYLPQKGIERPIGSDLTDAAATMREALSSVTALAAKWDQELTWLRSVDPNCPADEVQRGHAAAREGINLLRAALDIFNRVVLTPESAALDAPYGAGAPRRVHPGAQCTWVADRAESLARELSTVTLRKENLLLVLGRPSSPNLREG